MFVEVLLNAVGALTWDYTWWRAGVPWLIFLIGYLPFFLVAFWVFDMESVKQKAITVGSILGFDLVCLVVFGAITGVPSALVSRRALRDVDFADWRQRKAFYTTLLDDPARFDKQTVRVVGDVTKSLGILGYGAGMGAAKLALPFMAESKNASVVRKHMGYGYIAAPHAAARWPSSIATTPSSWRSKRTCPTPPSSSRSRSPFRA